MRILQLKAARGWSCEQAALVSMIDEQTLQSWLWRVNEQGERALVQSEMRRSLSRAIHRAGHPPKYIITDKGKQFWCGSFKRWCRRESILPQFGAVGEHGSIAIVERFVRSMKNECTFRILVPLRLEAMRHELGLYASWYNLHRPSPAVGGRTTWELYVGRQPANAKPRSEPRENWPLGAPCAWPKTTIRGERGTRLSLVVGYVEGRRHLPVVELRQAA
jgi:hypothetical protein